MLHRVRTVTNSESEESVKVVVFSNEDGEFSSGAVIGPLEGE
jgi:hypothetical protein